jgi:6-phosphogluconolactonase (cycloisomerase 2 family)
MTQLLVALILAISVLRPPVAGAAARFLDFVDVAAAPRLSGANDGVVSPDGAYLYVAAVNGPAITFFSRDAGTGALTFAGTIDTRIGATDIYSSYVAPRALALSPDGAHLYTIGYSGLMVFARDTGTGQLTWVETKSNQPAGPTSLSDGQHIGVSPDGAHIYATARQYGSIIVFGRNPTTGALTFVEEKVDGAPNELGGAEDLAISGDGAHVYVAGYNDSLLTVFSRNATTGALTFVESEGVSSVKAITVSGDGAHVYATSYYGSSISAYARDAGTGALTFEQVLVDGAGGITALSSPLDVMVTADGAHVYVVAGSDNALVVFARNAGNGHLTLAQEVRWNTPGVVGLLGVSSVTASPDGADLYATAWGYSYRPSVVSGFSRDAGTGALTQTQVVTSVDGSEALVLSPDAAHVYATGLSKITAYARDGGTGALTFAGDVTDGFGPPDSQYGPNALAISPDGAHVYASSSADQGVSVFARNAGTGALTFVEVHRDGVGGDDDLGGAGPIEMSADGAQLYVLAPYDHAVTVFARNAATGALTEAQVVQNGVGGIAGLESPQDFALSPDGGHLYVANANGIGAFGRNAGTGALAFVGSTTIDGYPYGVRRIGLSRDGAFLYFYNTYSKERIQVYARDAGSGALTQVGAVKSSEAGIGSSNGRFAFSPDGEAAYLGGTIFARAANGSLGFVGNMYGPFYYTGYTLAFGAGGEVYAASNAGVERWEPGFAGCDGGPLPSCRPADNGTLRLTSRSPNITWTWIGTGTVLTEDFGNPLSTTHYALCMWDESGPTPALIMRALAPAGQYCATNRGCWTQKTTGFTYRDRARTPEGMNSILLKAGVGTSARVKILAGQSRLVFPGLPLPVPVRVQIQSSDGECFGGSFSSPGVNTSVGYLARPD